MIKPRTTLDTIVLNDFKQDNQNWRLKLDNNENVYGCPYGVINTLKNIDNKGLSFFSSNKEFKEKISSFYELNSKTDILFVNNQTEALNFLLNAYLDFEDEFLLCNFNFDILEYLKIFNFKTRQISFSDFVFDELFFLNSISKKTKAIYISSPDNESGVLLKPSFLKKVVSLNPEILFIIDCSYINFASDIDFKDFIDLAQEYDNIALIKDYSSDYALAGLNCALIISNKDLIFNLEKIKSSNKDNFVSLSCLCAAIKDEKYLENIKEENFKAKELLKDGIEKLGYKVYLSEANFLLCDFSLHCEFYYNKLRKNGIIVKKYPKNSVLENHLRITIPKISGVKYILELLQKRELLIFEMDGVIFDIFDSYFKAIALTFEYFSSLKLSFLEILKIKNNGTLHSAFEIIDYLLKEKNILIDEKQIKDKFQENYYKPENQNNLIDSEKLLISKERLTELSKKYDLIIYTSRNIFEALYSLNKNFLENYFYFIETNEFFEKRKTKENSLNLIELLKKCPYINKAKFIGSCVDDIISGNKAGMYTIGVLPLIDDSNIMMNNFRHLGTDYILKDIKNLEDILAKLN